MKVYLASVEHGAGVNLYASISEDGLRAKVAAFCRHWAPREGLRISPNASHQDAISAYFAAAHDEYVSFGTDDIEIDAETA